MSGEPPGEEPNDGGNDREEHQDDGKPSHLRREEAVRDILKGAGVVYLGLVFNMGLAFLAQRFAAVYLSVDGFGGLTTGVALLNLGGIIAGLGLQSGLTRYLPRIDEDQKRPVVRYAYLLSLPLAIGLGGTVFFSAEFIAAEVFGEPAVATSIRVFAIAIPFATVLNLSLGGIRGQKLSRPRVYVENLIHPSVRFGLIILAVVAGLGQAGFALGYAVPFVVSAAVATYLFGRTLPKRADAVGTREIFLEMVRYSLPFTVSGLASFVYRSIDIFLLLYFVGSRGVGIYGVAYALARLLGMFSTAFNYLSEPLSSELESNDKVGEAIAVQRSIARWLTITGIMALVPLVLFGAELIGIVYRPAYAEGSLALSILAVGFVTKTVLQTNDPLVRALGHSKWVAFNTSIAGGVNLGANLLLIPRYGIEGAALATTLSFLLLGLLPMIQVRYYSGETTLSRQVVPPIIAAVPVGAVMVEVAQYVPASLPWIIVVGVVFVVAYGSCLLVLQGFTQTDVMVIRSIETKYGIDMGPLDAVVRRFS